MLRDARERRRREFAYLALFFLAFHGFKLKSGIRGSLNCTTQRSIPQRSVQRELGSDEGENGTNGNFISDSLSIVIACSKTTKTINKFLIILRQLFAILQISYLCLILHFFLPTWLC